MNTTAEILVQTLDTNMLEHKVKEIYHQVAENPQDDFHFALGMELAMQLGYEPYYLERIPYNAVESFAGVGHHFPLADIKKGESIVDFGSGSGMDCFIAALKTGNRGRVVGIDMTDAQLRKARSLARLFNVSNLQFTKGYLQDIPCADESFDVAISNGVINLVPDKYEVFSEAHRTLKSGGRMAISDIVTDINLPTDISCDAGLWAACIGGAMQIDAYVDVIEQAGLRVMKVINNPQYEFLSDGARWATNTYGVKSISILAVKP